MPVALCCPLHHEPLSLTPDGRALTGCRDGIVYPIVDGIPILLPFSADRDCIASTDWSVSQNDGATSLAFYNQTRDHGCYCREELPRERQDVERWLPEVQTTGPILEVGSGKGALQGIGDYVAADYSFTALRSYIDPRHQRVCATAERLPFPDASFAMIFSIAALEHVPNAGLAFDEIHRVLRPGGIAYLLPAWHCVQYNCEGIPVRPYRDLTLGQKWVKATLPIRRQRLFKALGAVPPRTLRRLLWLSRQKPTRFRFRRLKPDYERFWVSDSDAAARLDAHEACLYFHSRGYHVMAPGSGMIRQVLAAHEPVVVRKPSDR